jgi:hypothetical protein
MKALSIKQPWASLIAHGIKDIENRTWKTHFRGKVYIHASGKIADFFKGENLAFPLEQWHEINSKLDINDFEKRKSLFHTSAIIGEVEIIDCVINHPSIWAEKTPDCILGGCSKCQINGFCPETGNHLQSETGKAIYNWVLANPILYDKPILNVKGKLSFWEFEKPIINHKSLDTLV